MENTTTTSSSSTSTNEVSIYDPIVDTITNDYDEQQGFLSPPFLGIEINSKITKTIEDAVRKVNNDELDFLVMDISIHGNNITPMLKKGNSNVEVPNLDMRHMMFKHAISTKEYLFRTSDWAHCMVGKVDENAVNIFLGNTPTKNSTMPYQGTLPNIPALNQEITNTQQTTNATSEKSKKSKKQQFEITAPKTTNEKSNSTTTATINKDLPPNIEISKLQTLNTYKTASAAELVIRQELQFAVHLSLPAVLFPEPKTREQLTILGQLLNQILPTMQSTSVWVRFSANNIHNWNYLRSLCNYHSLLVPILEIKKTDLDSLENLYKNNLQNEHHKHFNEHFNPFLRRTHDEHVIVNHLSVWLSENVRSIILQSDIFINHSNDDTLKLPNYFTQFLKKCFKFETQFILNTNNAISEKQQVEKRIKKIIFSIFENTSPLTKVEVFCKSFRDYLQQPLQPLIDNLDSQVYETFERDPQKYKLYEDAIHKALIDLQKYKPREENKPFIVMVVGAGRGPLVKATLRASRSSNVPVQIYAVEKNPNALTTLLYYKKFCWQNENVTIIQQDMRVWNPPELADILVSELLGSFGDNELSPECLDGAQRLLKPNGEGISIPTQYVSYIAPYCSSKFYSEVKNLSGRKDFEGSRAFETPYVMLVHRGMELAKSQPCFSFIHPNPQVTEQEQLLKNLNNNNNITNNFDYLNIPIVDNSRKLFLKFKSEHNATIHGLVGYFHCVLYKDVTMSIVPETFSDGMSSWFPLVFPIETPIFVKRGEEINVNLFRCLDARKVWYEWSVATNNTQTKIHNTNGKHYFISL
ncbi:hypothetical protein ABK040_013138 [Willaertia magna]